jgi:hypothetical protein
MTIEEKKISEVINVIRGSNYNKALKVDYREFRVLLQEYAKHKHCDKTQELQCLVDVVMKVDSVQKNIENFVIFLGSVAVAVLGDVIYRYPDILSPKKDTCSLIVGFVVGSSIMIGASNYDNLSRFQSDVSDCLVGVNSTIDSCEA